MEQVVDGIEGALVGNVFDGLLNIGICKDNQVASLMWRPNEKLIRSACMIDNSRGEWGAAGMHGGAWRR